MPELIYKQEALDKLKYMYLLIERDRGQGCEVAKGLRKACRAISDIKAVDTESVRHGRWIFVSEETMHDGWTYRKHKCTECDYVTVEAKNFCQNCGARMDLRTPTEAQLDEADSVMMGGAENG